MPNLLSKSLTSVKSFWSTINKPIPLVRPDGSIFYTIDGSGTYQDTSNIEGQVNAYKLCSPVAGILNRKARAFTNARWYVLDSEGNEAGGSYATTLRTLMQRPNPMQSWNQFLAQAKIYEQLFGQVIILAVKPEGFNSPESTKMLWVIPNWILDIKLTGKLFGQTEMKEIVQEYAITVGGKRTVLPHADVIHMRDVNQNMENPVLGSSRLTSLQNEVSNIVASYEARNVLITRKGAIGILSNRTADKAGQIPVKKDEKEDIQQQFKKYGLSRNQWQVIITTANLNWQSMTFPTKDLMLFEEIEDDVRQIADSYDYPMYLLGFKNGSTFSNVEEAKKSLYQDAIIPEMESWVQVFNSYFQTEKHGFSISAWYDHLDVLQSSKKEAAEAIKIINEAYNIAYEKKIVTLQEWRTALELDPDNFKGDTFYEQNTTQQANSGADQAAQSGQGS